jgi:hypothetical protein
VWPTHSWYEVAPVSADHVKVADLPVRVEFFGGEMIWALTAAVYVAVSCTVQAPAA